MSEQAPRRSGLSCLGGLLIVLVVLAVVVAGIVGVLTWVVRSPAAGTCRAEAGGDPNPSKLRNLGRAQVGEHVTRFLAEHPSGGVADYGPWARANKAPSRSTVIDRFGTWSAAVEACRTR